jgi:hypothetical protein
MQKALQAIFLLFIKTNLPQKRIGRKFRGQSLVEVAIAFPILIMLFTGVVEFGFIMNYYLSLVDATRDSARLYSGGDPFEASLFRSPYNSDTFYYDTAFEVKRILDPVIDKPSYRGRRIVLDPALDDVIVSVYSADYLASGNRVVARRASPYHLFPTAGSVSGNHPSIFTAASILSTRVCGAPSAGILVVEIIYNYHHVLALPWMTAFLPNPLPLRAYTIMPIRAAEPDAPATLPPAPVCP